MTGINILAHMAALINSMKSLVGIHKITYKLLTLFICVGVFYFKINKDFLNWPFCQSNNYLKNYRKIVTVSFANFTTTPPESLNHLPNYRDSLYGFAPSLPSNNRLGWM
jgi:hypothetical protein